MTAKQLPPLPSKDLSIHLAGARDRAVVRGRRRPRGRLRPPLLVRSRSRLSTARRVGLPSSVAIPSRVADGGLVACVYTTLNAGFADRSRRRQRQRWHRRERQRRFPGAVPSCTICTACMSCMCCAHYLATGWCGWVARQLAGTLELGQCAMRSLHVIRPGMCEPCPTIAHPGLREASRARRRRLLCFRRVPWPPTAVMYQLFERRAAHRHSKMFPLTRCLFIYFKVSYMKWERAPS